MGLIWGPPPPSSFLAIPATSWVDDFLDWLNPTGRCCRTHRYGELSGQFCPSTSSEWGGGGWGEKYPRSPPWPPDIPLYHHTPRNPPYTPPVTPHSPHNSHIPPIYPPLPPLTLHIPPITPIYPPYPPIPPHTS